jgi:DNA-binding LytR/AlgR family response regulator
MVKSRFEQNPAFSTEAPLVTIAAATQDANIQRLMAYLDQYTGMTPPILPIKTTDQLVLLKPKQLILADINAGDLVLTTTSGILTTRETLVHFKQRLANPNFVQISKHALLNLDHLLALSESFSGAMTAKLSHDITTSVSRKYVQSLLQHLAL